MGTWCTVRLPCASTNMGHRRAAFSVDRPTKAVHHHLMSSTAEILQDQEDRGHRWASSLLVHAREDRSDVRIAALRFVWGHIQYGSHTSAEWRAAAKKHYGPTCAFMVGVELAIEQYEAKVG